MAIYFHNDYSKKHGESNFGDDINPYLLSHFLPKSLYHSTDECVVGIGTLLNNGLLKKISGYEKVHVFSSGVGYGEYEQLIGNTNINFISVRGPKSAEALNLTNEKAITDGAILLAELKDKSEKVHKVTFIPHVNTHWTTGELLARACEKLGFNYLVPNVNHFDFMAIVNASDLIITEAMHGAILADTYRVPWIPVKMHNALDFKWRDWCQSMDITYQPFNLIKSYNSNDSLLSKLKTNIKYQMITAKLSKISKLEPTLSHESVFENRLSKMIKLTETIR